MKKLRCLLVFVTLFGLGLFAGGPHCELECWDFAYPNGMHCVYGDVSSESECILWWTSDGWECHGYAFGCLE